ncbi:hypothetical protein GEMRC1_000152 [Eukaryota sp. GEM-RC1]
MTSEQAFNHSCSPSPVFANPTFTPSFWTMLSLWSASHNQHLSLRIPDVVILDHGVPISWFFTAKDGTIRRHLPFKTSIANIRDSFLSQSQRFNSNTSPTSFFVRLFISSSLETQLLTRSEFRRRIFSRDPSDEELGQSRFTAVQCYFEDFCYNSWTFSLDFKRNDDDLGDKFTVIKTINPSIASSKAVIAIVDSLLDQGSKMISILIDWLEQINQLDSLIVEGRACFVVTHQKELFLTEVTELKLQNENFDFSSILNILSDRAHVHVNSIPPAPTPTPQPKKFKKLVNYIFVRSQ